jgi:hypothetical protein
MGRLADSGRVDDAIGPLVAVRGNALGDWLSILAWAERFAAQAAIDQSRKDELATTLRSLRSFGAPHLYGYREKYDDAWSAMNGGKLWDRLSMIAERAADDLPEPMEEAGLAVGVALCRKRLIENHALMTTTHAREGSWIWLLLGEEYRRTPIDRAILLEWKFALQQYAGGRTARHEFVTALRRFTDRYRAAFDPLLDEVARAGCASLRYLPDHHDAPPLAGLAMLNPALRRRMLRGEFEVRVVPAVHAAAEITPASIRTLAAVHSRRDRLRLAAHEGAAMASAAGLELREITTDDYRDLAEMIGDADALLVSTHGSSLSLYSDAYFARLGSKEEPHPIGVEGLQLCAPDLLLRLVLLNSCHSASGSGRNYQQMFRTSDAVTIPGLFLTNRLAVAGGNGWPVSDTAAFLFAVLIGEAIEEGHAPARAFNAAAARLRDLTTARAIELVMRIPESEARKDVLSDLAGGPSKDGFSDLYVSGGLHVFGLL